MANHKVNLSLGTRSVTNKVEFGRTVIEEMTGNANFATPSPSLTDIGVATDGLETAFILAQSGSHLAVADQKVAEADWNVLMTALAAYVENIAQGSESIIVSAGMKTRKIPSPIGIPAKVVNLTARPLEVAGTIRLRWKPVYGKKSYNVYMAVEGEAGTKYELVAQPTSSRITLDGLTSGAYYSFKVEAVGSAGIGALSDSARAIAF
jgi:hypothetical protein